MPFSMDVSPSGEPSAIERKVNADGATILLPVTHTFISMGKTKVSREIMHILLEENKATRPALHSATVNQQTPPYKKSGRGWGSNQIQRISVWPVPRSSAPLSVKYTFRLCDRGMEGAFSPEGKGNFPEFPDSLGSEGYSVPHKQKLIK